MHRVHIWDLPTRLCHWLLAASIASAFITAQIGGNLIDWHGRIGLFIVGLLVFRLVWGILGTHTARFASFVRGPAAIGAYLRGEWQGVGHNPLGALSVLGLLLLAAAQVGTGLCANDDISFQGPFAAVVGKELSDQLTSLHENLFTLLLALVLLHIGAITFYLRVKKENLVKPMFTGWKEGATEESLPPARGGGPAAILIALGLAGLAAWAASGSWQAPAAMPAPNTAPNSAPAW